MKRKLMLVLLAGLLAVGLVGVSAPAARADDTVYTEGTLYYTITNESITITGCFGKNEEIHVPAMIAGIPVNTIASGAFANNEYVKTVYLPDTISKVEPGAFGEGVRVIYNANTDHPQDTPTDLILGLLTPVKDEPEVTEAPVQTESPTAAPTQAPENTPPEGSGSDDIDDLSTPAPTKRPSSQGPAVTAAPAVTPDAGSGEDDDGDDTFISEVDVDLSEDEPTASPEPTEVPATEAPKATDAPKVAEVKATAAPVKTEPTATPEPAPAEAGRGSGWIWGVGGAAAVIAGAAVLLKKRRKA